MTLATLLSRLDAKAHAAADWGAVAAYIPQLACVNPAQFAISVALADGSLVSAGQAKTRFSIQSVSKVFTLACVLSRIGESIWARVGREPSGDRFDSILLLEQEQGRPRNPFINAGALVTTDELLAGRAPREALSEVLEFLRVASGDDDIHIDSAVAASEQATGYRNIALANYLKSYDNLINEPDLVLGTYFHQCAIEMTTEQLALAGRGIAGLPGAPLLLSARKRRRLAALMMTCGHYDGSGDFAFRTGLPGKSGVGGGILVAVPGVASVAVWSPGLNAWGNSKVGTEAIETLAHKTGWSVFG
ncbi:glutaminase [Vannielia sp.]|uniref:glutaminase n=1 Tax=Vannielia sp. TaxID=2813045 RepID=UPI0026048CA2|nr:glutaminase [Vannielia sp.]MDF1871186.1 glutaminase [Vannielia sp.]